MLIIIALQTEQSITRLFIASIVPGLLLAALFLITVFLLCTKYPALGPAGSVASFRDKIRATPGIFEAVILFLLVIGGLYAGWFTPTEAGAVGSFGVLIIALLLRRLSWSDFSLAVFETLRISAMVMILVTGAVVFGRFLTITRFPFMLTEWASSLPVAPAVVMVVVLLVYVLGGALMDALGFLTVSTPIFFPLAGALGYDPLWHTIVITIITTMGAVTPPVGVNVFVINGLAPDIPVETVFKGASYFLPAYVACLILLMLFPQIVLFLPEAVF